MQSILRCHAGLFLSASLSLVGLLAACDANPKQSAVGSMAITTTSPAPTWVTADEWNVKLDRLLVHVTAVTVAGNDGVVAAASTPQLIDALAPGAKVLLSAGVRTARSWDDVSLEIGPAAVGDIIVIPPVTEADRGMMTTGGYSLHVEGSATKAGVTKTLKWGFTVDTIYKDCTGDLNGASVRGLVVPQNGNDSADVVLDGSVLFADDLDAARAVRRFEAIAAADADNDGQVTIAELHATPLETAIAAGGAYGVGDKTDVVDLGAFVETLAGRTLTSFRARGACTATPAQ